MTTARFNIDLPLQLQNGDKNQNRIWGALINDAMSLPKSQVEFYPEAGDMVGIRIPESLAEKHGLV